MATEFNWRPYNLVDDFGWIKVGPSTAFSIRVT